MIKGCSNHGCAVKGETPGMHTNGICRCVQVCWRDKPGEPNPPILIEINGVPVGPDVGEHLDGRQIADWLRKGGLHDILALERKEKIDG
jgi:hypothetical protein